MKTTFNIYEKITEKFISALDKNEVPWHKPWRGVDMAISHANGRAYSMLNQFLLDNIAGEWLSFKQIEDGGGHIIKGKKPHFVVFWKFLPKYGEDENGNSVEIGTFPILKYYNVWHISEVEGIKPKYKREFKSDATPNELAEGIFNNYVEREGLIVERDREVDKACYTPIFDKIQVPKMSQFENTEYYYSTLFHEMVHSTGAEKRLCRKGIVEFNTFGSEQYSKEELIAELGAAFLVNHVGLDTEKSFDNSLAYIQSWRSALSKDSKLIVSAASKAEQAAKYILTGAKSQSEDA